MIHVRTRTVEAYAEARQAHTYGNGNGAALAVLAVRFTHYAKTSRTWQI